MEDRDAQAMKEWRSAGRGRQENMVKKIETRNTNRQVGNLPHGHGLSFLSPL